MDIMQILSDAAHKAKMIKRHEKIINTTKAKVTSPFFRNILKQDKTHKK